ncbi:adenylyltransferase/cytidyltransferase family protein [Microtetraspora sp. AC03309]|uniref:adenylyltransferase/cytidyltransferase family protein n=1 Tax=Microtetraspora sp. AC03309 TaxID=2779376 RepID=UPI001E41888C|nr:adenylyltransferase/cytidyltransferase family protein [Microtetraspora sp. AC03309]MCC5574673.1 adenylyltransferase/cytidyltransferase family protein [Microtetraspora sp. AC03309]
MTEDIVARFGDLTAVVVGDVMLDSWLRGRTERMAQEADHNGSFDVPHRGHVACLDEAARLGDVLVVAVNARAIVNRIRG